MKSGNNLCRRERKANVSHLLPSPRVYVEHSLRQVPLPGHLVPWQLVGKPVSPSWVNPPHAAEAAERERDADERQVGDMGEWMGERVREWVGWKNREKERDKKETEEEMRRQKRGARERSLRKKTKGKQEARGEPRAHGIPLPSLPEQRRLEQQLPRRAPVPWLHSNEAAWPESLCVRWAGLWFHRLAGQVWPPGAAQSRRVTWHRALWPSLILSAC